MADYSYAELDTAPIIKDNIYRYGPRGGSTEDPFCKLLRVGSGGGIRAKRTKDKRDYAYVVLVSTKKSVWNDEYDPQTGIFIYHGDNNKADGKLDGKGNKTLLNIVNDSDSNVPLLIFESTIDEVGGSKNAYRFIGVATPHYGADGKCFYRDTFGSGEDAFDNYVFKLQLIDTGSQDLRQWLDSIVEGREDSYDKSPIEWKEKMTIRSVVPKGELSVKDGTNPFMQFLQEKGFQYNVEFIEDFLLGLKAKRFMIFCGGTGTGKTKLAQLYCEFIGAENRIVPVGSNWTDSKYMMGYRNAITKDVERKDALKLIEASVECPEKPFFLILDEMNLSHIERYFSEFLSVMESNDKMRAPDDKELELKDNLFIIGTMNLDETTYSISPKVLDRANVMVFEPADIEEYLGNIGQPFFFKGDVKYLNDCMDCRSGKRKANDLLHEINDGSIMSFLVELQKSMKEMKMPFGYRTVDEVMRFIYSAWIYEGKPKNFNWKRYMESQVLMKILPKIHGDVSLKPGLTELKSLLFRNDMPKASEKVRQMIDALELRRYTSFIS